MPIEELSNFRTKFPQYDDLGDLELAKALGRKFPEYAHLEQKV